MQYTDLLEIKLYSEIKDIELESMIQAIESMRNKEYWESKNNRLACLKDSQEIATILLMNTIGFVNQIQELVGKLAPKLSKGCTYVEKVQNASDIIEACNNLHYKAVIGEHIMIESFHKLSEDTYEYIELRTYAPPMVVKPKDWTSNTEGGYYDTPIHCILGSSHNHHNKPQALDVLNLLQGIEWELDPYILAMDEKPNKPFKSPQSHKQFMDMAQASKATYSNYADKPLWLIWQFDKRGRQYSKGYHINLQASSYKKALLSFAHKELITGEL